MPEDSPTPEIELDSATADMLARLVTVSADVAQRNPHAVRHGGPCGQRLFCDRPEHRSDGYKTVERLPGGFGHNPGELAFHCEHHILRRSDPGYAERLAGMEP